MAVPLVPPIACHQVILTGPVGAGVPPHDVSSTETTTNNVTTTILRFMVYFLLFEM